jgi:hypothetical protein
LAHVTIVESGREGRVEYADGPNAVSGYWEFGGNDIVTIVSMGSVEDWQRSHSWGLEKRPSILRFIADEVIRQKAPSCAATIDEQSGVISLRQRPSAAPPASATAATRQAQAVAFVNSFRDLRMMLATGLLIALVIVGVIVWLGQRAMMVSATISIPFNESVRFEANDPSHAGIATLMHSTDSHFRDTSGRGVNTTSSLSILLTPLDGSASRLIPVVGRVSSHFQLARIMGSDGRTVWFDATGLYGVRLDERRLVTPDDLRAANPDLDPTWWEDPRGMDVIAGNLHVMRIDRTAAVNIDPDTWKAAPTAPKHSNARFDRREPADHLASGVLIEPGAWLGVLSQTEQARDFKRGSWIKPVKGANVERRVLRRLIKVALEPSSEGDHFRVKGIAPLAETDFLEAAFVRMNDKVEPLRLSDPDSALMIHTSAPGLAGTLVMSRVDFQGNLLWSTDTGLDRFNLKQILPGAEVIAFVGIRPPIPDKLSEPLIVLVDAKTGKLTSHSLWR